MHSAGCAKAKNREQGTLVSHDVEAVMRASTTPNVRMMLMYAKVRLVCMLYGASQLQHQHLGPAWPCIFSEAPGSIPMKVTSGQLQRHE
eukprot:353426-Chlamydomonas_euryale.AAC.5